MVKKTMQGQSFGSAANAVPALGQSVLSLPISVSNPQALFANLGAELLRLGHGVRFRASGKSMHPTIRDGEKITVQSSDQAEVRVGDIVLCRSRQGVVAHRLVGVRRPSGRVNAGVWIRSFFDADRQMDLLIRSQNRDRFSTLFLLRGDASLSSDGAIRSQQILGRVVAVERDGRSIDLTSRRARLVWMVRRCAVVLRNVLKGTAGV